MVLLVLGLETGKRQRRLDDYYPGTDGWCVTTTKCELLASSMMVTNSSRRTDLFYGACAVGQTTEKGRGRGTERQAGWLWEKGFKAKKKKGASWRTRIKCMGKTVESGTDKDETAVGVRFCVYVSRGTSGMQPRAIRNVSLHHQSVQRDPVLLFLSTEKQQSRAASELDVRPYTRTRISVCTTNSSASPQRLSQHRDGNRRE